MAIRSRTAVDSPEVDLMLHLRDCIHTLSGTLQVRRGRVYQRRGMVIRELGPLASIVHRERPGRIAGCFSSRFGVEDILSLGELFRDRAALKAKICEMVDSSGNMRAEVESLCTQTGEYRVVLKGSLGIAAPLRKEGPRKARDREGGGAPGTAGEAAGPLRTPWQEAS